MNRKLESSSPAVLYDGWSLVFRPNSFDAVHLLTILECQPNGWRSVLALPGKSIHRIPDWVEVFHKQSDESGFECLLWEQHQLPQIAKKVRAGLIHLTTNSPPLIRDQPIVISPAKISPGSGSRWSIELDSEPGGHTRFVNRLRNSLAEGGLARISRLLWPSDLPKPLSPSRVELLPPAIHPSFRKKTFTQVNLSPAIPGGLPEQFVLYHGAGNIASLHKLLEIWTWVTRSITPTQVLLIAGLDEAIRKQIPALVNDYGVQDSVFPLPNLVITDLTAIYQTCSALINPDSIHPWGDPIRNALVCGKPVAALESPLSDVVAGPAAYLVPAKEDSQEFSRALGAALMTLLIDESLSEQMKENALKQSSSWYFEKFRCSLSELYAELLSPKDFSRDKSQPKT